ncbi:MAG: hypothetical protein ACFFAO_22140 [Candidatus Hermodarchaeota archaeon]
MGKKQFLIILLIFLLLAIFFGIFIENSINIFFSWLLVGTWIIFSIIFIEKTREKKEYNSPHNTPFFVFGPLSIGFFYSFWSYFTGFLEWNLLERYGISLYLSPWTLFFSVPYLFYGLYVIRSCFKKFNVVYVIKNRSVGARKFGTSYIIMILLGLLFFLLFNNSIMNFFRIIVSPINEYYSIFNSFGLWMIGITSIYFLIRHSIFGRNRSIPQITSDYVARRRSRIESISSPSTRARPQRRQSSTTSRSRPRRQTTTTSIRSRPRSQTTTSSSRTKPRGQTTKASQSRSKPKSSTKARSTATRKPTAVSADFERLKPKAGILSLEDFKCIFCFNLPSSPSDDGRGIILCPKCRHPAHADEFKEWLQNSTLCSRCDAPIPLHFRQNPVIIPVKQYVQVINEFKRRNR